jgi:hypothetical protein
MTLVRKSLQPTKRYRYHLRFLYELGPTASAPLSYNFVAIPIG